MSRRFPRFSPALLLWPLAALSPCALPLCARAQGVSPEAAPAAPEATSPQLSPTGPQTETTPVNPPAAAPKATGEAAPATAPATTAGATSPAAAPGAPAPKPHLEAASVSYSGTTIMATGTPETPVRFTSAAGLIVAQQVQLDTDTQQLQASGQVQFERERQVRRKELRPRRLPSNSATETFRETAFGNDLNYNFQTGEGTLDGAKLRLSALTITAQSLIINGQDYRARNVILRPGGLSDEELKIYGTPPFSLHAREVTAAPVEKNGAVRQRVTLRGGGLYFGKTRLLPVPNYSFFPGGGPSNNSRITPGISLNSADRLLVTTSFNFPINRLNPDRLNASADVGYSARVGFRGGLGLNSATPAGNFALDLRKSDVISSQLTNRIELDRKPEFTYRSPAFLQFNLGKQRAGFAFDGGAGDFTERLIGRDTRVSDTRARARLILTTRLQPGPGAFARLFSAYSSYGKGGTYRNNGVEVGYDGQLLNRLRGQISVRLTDVKGNTPFRFDRVEIRRELRATVDYQLAPRYIIPIDLRYDLQQSRFRDQTFGVLRSYKTFAYGLAYQTSRHDLRLEIRQGF